MSPAPGTLEAACVRWLQRPALQLETGLLVALLFATGSASQLFVNWSVVGLRPTFPGLLALKVTEFGLWAAVVPLVVWVDRRTPWTSGWLRPSAIHLGLAVAIFLVINIPVTALMKMGDAVQPSMSFPGRYAFRMAYRMPSSWITYAGILAVIKLIQAFVRSRELDRDLTRAQLRVLQDQLQPHFLFNTLHTAGSLVRAGDRDGAVETLVTLSDLLRRSLSYGSEGTVPLEEEVEFLERYLDIHRKRFGEHLGVYIDIPDELGSTRVPPFLLQPLVENAIRHGLDLERVPGELRVEAEAVGRHLVLRVRDSGGTLQPAPATDDEKGIGLANLRRRLATLYGDRASLRTGTRDGASVVTVRLPSLEPEP